MSPLFRKEDRVAIQVVAAGLVVLAFIGASRRKPLTECCHDLAARPLDAPILANPNLRTGTLGNGLRWYVQRNVRPSETAELRLVVRAGSVLETEAQRGLAHAVEHMVFRGTRNFPHHAISDWYESIGMRSGSDVNAFTTQDETVYRMTVPTDRRGPLDTALAILADIAREATFDSVEATHEGGIVFEEWRSRRDAVTRVHDARMQVIAEGTRYATHTPIGDTAVLRKFDVHEMRRFYRTWYRPDLMAVVVVGDINANATVRAINRRFSGQWSADTSVVPVIALPRPTQLRTAVLADDEAGRSSVALWFPREMGPRRILADYRAELIRVIARSILNDRFARADDDEAFMLDASADYRLLAGAYDAEVVSASIPEGNALVAVDHLLGELQRLAGTGPTDHELRRTGEELLRNSRRLSDFNEISEDVAEDLGTEFLTGRVALSRDARFAMVRDLLPGITGADVQQQVRQFSVDSAAVLLAIVAPADAPGPTATMLAERARTSAVRALAQRSDSLENVVLMPSLPTPGTVVREQSYDDINTFDWTLSNGLRVLLKPSAIARKEIEFRLWAPGGASLASDADYPSAWHSDNIVRATGVGSLTGAQLYRVLDTTSIAFEQQVNDDAITFSGSADEHDLETLFQIIHLHATAPRADAAAFRRYRMRVVRQRANRGNNPDATFEDSLQATTAQYRPRALRGHQQFSDAVTLGQALNFWSARLSNASNMSIVFVGDFKPERLRPLVTRYLASLPQGTREAPRDDGIRFPPGVVQRTVRAGVGPRSRTRIVISGAMDASAESMQSLSTTRDLVEFVLNESLRETLGGTYGVNVESDVRLLPPNRFELSVDFEADVERIDSLASVALADLERLHRQGPSKGEFAKLREAEIRDLDGSLSSNGYWVDEIAAHARLGWPLASIREHRKEAEQLTADAVRKACARFLSTAQHVRVTMVPGRNSGK